MKKKKNIIILSIIVFLLLIIGIAFFIYVNSKKIENNINATKISIEENNYEKAYKIINENNLLEKANTEIKEIINENISKYKIEDINTLVELTNNEWENIESFNKMINDLKLTEVSIEYNYFNIILRIKQDEGKYFNAIRWINSAEYEQYKMYNELLSNDESAIINTSNLLAKYSFEKYDLSSTYIKELNEETKKLSNSYSNIAKALHNQDINLLENAKIEAQETLVNIADIQIKILLKANEIEIALKSF